MSLGRAVPVQTVIYRCRYCKESFGIPLALIHHKKKKHLEEIIADKRRSLTSESLNSRKEKILGNSLKPHSQNSDSKGDGDKVRIYDETKPDSNNPNKNESKGSVHSEKNDFQPEPLIQANSNKITKLCPESHSKTSTETTRETSELTPTDREESLDIHLNTQMKSKWKMKLKPPESDDVTEQLVPFPVELQRRSRGRPRKIPQKDGLDQQKKKRRHTTQAVSLEKNKMKVILRSSTSRVSEKTKNGNEESKEEELSCPVCNLVVEDTGKLRDHIHLVHPNFKEHKCNDCPYVTDDAGLFYRHQRLHDSGNVFICLYCTASFPRLKHWSVHVKEVHPEHWQGEENLLQAQIDACPPPRKSSIHPPGYYTKLAEPNDDENFNRRVSNGSKASEEICTVCGETLGGKGKLDVHYKECHPDVKNFKCRSCPFRSRRRDGIILHEKLHKNTNPYKCNHCTASFRNSIHKTRHMKAIHNEVENSINKRKKIISTSSQNPHCSPSELKCEHCDMSFKSNTTLRRHVRQDCSSQLPTSIRHIQEGASGPVILHSCRHCSANSLTQSALQIHIDSIHGQKDGSCCVGVNSTPMQSQAGERFFKVQGKPTGSQVLSVLGIKCERCDKSFLYPLALKHHNKKCHPTQVHGSTKANVPFPCSICKMICVSQVALRLHRKRHILKMLNKCPECAFTTSIPLNLQVHMRNIHSDDPSRAVQCLYCSAKFKSVVGRRVHTSKVHKQSANNNSEVNTVKSTKSKNIGKERRQNAGLPKIAKCDLCPQMFTSKLNVQIHMETIHMRLDAYKCTDCTASYKFSKLLIKHQKFHEISNASATSKRVKGQSVQKNRVTASSMKRSQRQDFGGGTKTANLTTNQIQKVSKGGYKGRFKCPLCPLVCQSKFVLDSHVEIVHEREDQFKCGKCTASYMRQQHLLLHMQLHEALLDPTKQFSQIAAVDDDMSECEELRQMNTSERLDNTPPVSLTTTSVKCPRFLIRNERSGDVKTERKGNDFLVNYPYSCALCRYNFSHYLDYDRHLSSIWHIKTEKTIREKEPLSKPICSLCHQIFVYGTHLTAHMMVRHGIKPTSKASLGTTPKSLVQKK